MASTLLPFLFTVFLCQASGDNDRSTFAAPVQMMAGDEALGHAQLYPSPALFDLDGDGISEMIVGDLVGNLMVSKRVAGDDRLAWTPAEPLEGADGERLEFHNW